MSTTNDYNLPGEVPEAAEDLLPRTAEQAARELAEQGRPLADARAMVADYLDATSAEIGVPVHQWGLDAHDVAEIEARFDWVDHTRGETLAQARDRASEWARDWADKALTVDRQQEPGYASRVDRAAAEWAERARTTPVPATVDEDPTADEATDTGEDEDPERATGSARAPDPLDAARDVVMVLPAQIGASEALDADTDAAGHPGYADEAGQVAGDGAGAEASW
jgi:hypothetical protein